MYMYTSSHHWYYSFVIGQTRLICGSELPRPLSTMRVRPCRMVQSLELCHVASAILVKDIVLGTVLIHGLAGKE